MGIFGNSSPYDEDVEKATSENNTSEQWGLIMELCDRVSAALAGAGGAAGGREAAREVLRAALRRLAHADPHVALQAATLLDALVSNCPRAFLLEVASRDFEAEFRRVVARAQPAVGQRLRALLRKWAEGEFRDDPQLDLIPALHARLGRASPAPAAPAPAPAAPAAAAAAREQDELARAIALSLKESTPAASLYPAVDAPPPAAPAAPAPPAPRQVRALYDFEAAEDNELTFLAGEIVTVTEWSDPNWWKGHNARGEGLFPANFVTSDLSEREPEPAKGGKSVQFAGETDADSDSGSVGSLDGGALDEALGWLLAGDPAAPPAPAERRAERRAARAGRRVDRALQRADTRHARLTQLSAELVDALNLYHELMREPHKGLGAPPHGPPLAPPLGPPHAPPLAPPPPGTYYAPPNP
ncbi:hypothetical protein JYU34_002079, partial [Plutella xylostella]